jgi:phosphatidylglycerophosphatase C
VPYLAFALSRFPARIPRLWRVPFLLAPFLVHRDRGRLKSALVRALLGGLTRREITETTRAFLDARLTALVRPTAIAAIEAHRAAGDRLVLLSASTDFYVPAIGERLGFDEVICTGIAWTEDRLDGALTTPNRRGTEKTRCLERLRLGHPGLGFAAYGNAGSDLDHLTTVEHPLVVNASAATRRHARSLGLPTADWR